MSRPAPRPFAIAVEALRDRLEPAGGLAGVQRVWHAVAGDAIAAAARPVALRGGVLTVECESAVWAQELQLIGPDLVAQLSDRLGDAELQSIRSTVAGPR